MKKGRRSKKDDRRESVILVAKSGVVKPNGAANHPHRTEIPVVRAFPGMIPTNNIIQMINDLFQKLKDPLYKKGRYNTV
jgi:hypothetical protein